MTAKQEVYTPCAVANEFLRLAAEEGRVLTNMQVQKLVFLAHGYHLAILGQPLYSHATYAWPFGPVVRTLYEQLRQYGNGEVTAALPTKDQVAADSVAADIIAGVWEGYGDRTGSQLSALSHKKGSPWRQTWEKDKFGVILPDTIAAYYKSLFEGGADEIRRAAAV